MKIDHTKLFGGNFDAMSPADVGVSFMIAKYIFDSKKESIPMDLAHKIVDRGHSHGFDPAVSISFLIKVGVLEETIHDGEPMIGFPVLSKIIERENEKHLARVIGWDSRRNTQLVKNLGSKKTTRQAKAAEPEDETSVVCEILCKNDKLVKITEKWVEEKAPLYSGVDIKRELLMAAEWCRVNPTRRKTANGVGKFLMTWLSNARTREQTVKHVVSAASTAKSGFGTGGRQTPVVDPAKESTGKGDGVDLLEDILGGSRQPAESPAAAAQVRSVRKPLLRGRNA